MSWEDAPDNFSNWRHATNDKVEGLFNRLFDGYYDTNTGCTSYSNEADEGSAQITWPSGAVTELTVKAGERRLIGESQ